MRSASVVALVFAGRPMVGEALPSVAPDPATPQLRIEGVQDLAIDPPQCQLPERRAHVSLEVPLVGPARRTLELDDLEVPIQQLVERRAGAWAASFVDLAQQPRPYLLGFLGCSRPSWPPLRQHQLLARQRIHACVDPHA